MSNNQYAVRDALDLDKRGDYYTRHISAISKEDLHNKADIAAELGYRDMMLDRTKRIIDERNEQITELTCALKLCINRLDEECGFTGAANTARLIIDQYSTGEYQDEQ